MLRVQDIGEVGYGGLVELAKWWDEKRMTEGTLTEADIMKKAETYAYLVPGGAATIMSALGTWRRQELWLEHISHGFMYGFSGWIREVVKNMSPAASRTAVVREAQRIEREAQRIERGPASQLGSGARTARSYQREFESSRVF